MDEKLSVPKWHKELDTYSGICSTFIIEGNVYDMQAMVNEQTNQYRRVGIQQYLTTYFNEAGYRFISFYNCIDGFNNSNELYNLFDNFFSEKQKMSLKNCEKMTRNDAISIIRCILQNNKLPSVVIVNYASFMLSDPNRLDENEIENWGELFLGSLNSQIAKYESEKPLNNLLILVTSKMNDIPAWFYVNNPYCKVIHISKPNKDIRKRFFQKKAHALKDYEILQEKGEMDIKADVFANLTEGFSSVDLEGVIKLCKEREISALNVKKAIDLLKYGEQESRWDAIDPQFVRKIREARSYLEQAIIGQPGAVKKVSDVLNRSISGLSGIQSNSYGHPKGVLFFAGPTGTGKTEMAKKIAQLIFDDENAMIRFDMSEYNLEHSNQRLIGAPPGYVGYSEGGQLTNAVKENPFCVLLFDEIDKAHPRIMDIFLQILEDGRVTDSAGETVYFSECIIIFTSNAGMNIGEANQQVKYPHTVSANDSYQELETKLTANVAWYFKSINRMEIYNRLGGNVIVFDFIRRDEARIILEMKLNRIVQRLFEERSIILELRQEYIDTLSSRLELNEEYGGRGVVNHIERYFVNPLARVFVEEEIVAGKKVIIKGLMSEELLDYEVQ